MKRRILFVDDEQNILDGLRRMLRSMRKEWDMAFASSGEEALAMLEKSPFDLVVTDMRMPGMDGAQLLMEVRKRYPDSIRIVLSGQSDEETVMSSVGAAHQYLSKPCDADTIKYTVARSCNLRSLLQDQELKRLVSRIKSLPSLPSVYQELMQELRTEEPVMERLGRIIQKDMGMTTKILQLVNSAFFGLPREITSVSHAIMLLGIDTIKSLVLSVGIFSQLKHGDAAVFSAEQLMQHSFLVGAAARQIAKAMELDETEINAYLLAGTLHDVGKLVLAANLPKRYARVFTLVKEEEMPLGDAEMAVFRATHAQVGGYLLGLWGIQDSVVETAIFHHHPGESFVKKFCPLVAVHAANAFVHESARHDRCGPPSQIDLEFLRSLGLEGRIAPWRERCRKVCSQGAR